MGEHRAHAQNSKDPRRELSNDAIILLLNELISVCMNGFVGYARIASGIEVQSLRDLFHYYATRRQHHVSDLAGVVQSLGGEPVASGTENIDEFEITQGWQRLAEYLAAQDVPSLLGECEAAEKLMKEVYKRVLAQPMPVNIRNMVQSQYVSFNAVRQQLHAVRRAYLN